MYMWGQIALLVLGGFAVLFSNIGFGKARKELSSGQHRLICVAVFVVGSLIRLWNLSGLPEGLNAEEALVGVQAKSFVQTGGFLFGGGLTTQLFQWTEEATGPLYSVLASPFVTVLGMNSLAVRLPMALLSIGAMLAAYGIGNELGGKRLARWCMTIFAVCPAFVLNARFAVSANAAVFLMPIALCLVLMGLRRSVLLYLGMALLGLTAYTQHMYMLIAPIMLLAGAAMAWKAKVSRKHVLGAFLIGTLLSIPALLTIWVNASGRESLVIGPMTIPYFGLFDEFARVWGDVQTLNGALNVLQNQLREVARHALFQTLGHETISDFMFAPEGMGTLYLFSVPVMALGAIVLLCKKLESPDEKGRCARWFVLLTGGLVLLLTAVFSDGGRFDFQNGITNIYDYSTLLVFEAVLMAIGLTRIEEKSAAGIIFMTALFALSFGIFVVFLFGGKYQNYANTHFIGLDAACAQAGDAQEETNAKVYMTKKVYPHVSPDEASEMMYLFASGCDIAEYAVSREQRFELIYPESVVQPQADGIYLVYKAEAAAWDTSAFDCNEYGEFLLLIPKGTK